MFVKLFKMASPGFTGVFTCTLITGITKLFKVAKVRVNIYLFVQITISYLQSSRE